MRKFSICHYGGAGINLRRLPRLRHFRRRRSTAAGSKLYAFAASAAASGKAAIPTRLQLGGWEPCGGFSVNPFAPFLLNARWGYSCANNFPPALLPIATCRLH